MSGPQIKRKKNNHCFEVSSSLILGNNNKPFFNQIVTFNEKRILIRQVVITSSVTGPRRSSKALTKSKLEPKKAHVHCWVVCCLSDPLSFLNSRETITSEKYAQQINEMHQKLQCLQPVLVNRPILLHDNA